jgi:phosphoglycolate phosphatase
LKNSFSDLPLIFDLDGTLADSANQIFTSLNLACEEVKVTPITKTLFFETLGLPIKSILSHLDLSASDEIRLINLFREKLQFQIEDENILFPGVEEFLKNAKRLGYPLAIATSKPTYLAKLVVANSPLVSYVDFVQGTDNFPAKPAPDVILKCLSNFSVSRGVMFGDRIEDMVSASSAGIPSIGIAQGFHTISDLVSAGAQIAFKNFFELEKVANDSDFFLQLYDYFELPDCLN